MTIILTLNREVLSRRFGKVVSERTKLESDLDARKYKSKTDQRHVYESKEKESLAPRS